MACVQVENQTVVHTNLLSFLNQLRKGGGLSIVASIIPNLSPVTTTSKNLSKIHSVLKKYLEIFKIEAFTEVISCDSILNGIGHCLQSVGIGALRPNTILIGFPKESSESKEFVDIIRMSMSYEKVLLVLKAPIIEDLQVGYIDVYWIIRCMYLIDR